MPHPAGARSTPEFRRDRTRWCRHARARRNVRPFPARSPKTCRAAQKVETGLENWPDGGRNGGFLGKRAPLTGFPSYDVRRLGKSFPSISRGLRNSSRIKSYGRSKQGRRVTPAPRRRRGERGPAGGRVTRPGATLAQGRLTSGLGRDPARQRQYGLARHGPPAYFVSGPVRRHAIGRGQALLASHGPVDAEGAGRRAERGVDEY